MNRYRMAKGLKIVLFVALAVVASHQSHSAAVALNRPLPRPEQIAGEIDALSNWADDLRQRQSRVT